MIWPARSFGGPLICSEGCTTELDGWFPKGFLAERVQPALNPLQLRISGSLLRTTALSRGDATWATLRGRRYMGDATWATRTDGIDAENTGLPVARGVHRTLLATSTRRRGASTV